MNLWRDLIQELDTWATLGRTATLWWRDDDAVEPTPALERLLDLAAAHDLPVALAVIPVRASEALAHFLAKAGPKAIPLQHGFAHRNYASASEKKAELGAHRPPVQVLEELARGAARMTALFGAEFLPVLIPPWNRIAPELFAPVRDLGFIGVSTHGPRGAAEAAPGLVQINSHMDIMRWREPRGFLGREEALAQLTGHLRARRTGAADVREPSGILTHHLAHDEACWGFLEDLLPRLAAHPAVHFTAPGEIFAPLPFAPLPKAAEIQGTRGAA